MSVTPSSAAGPDAFPPPPVQAVDASSRTTSPIQARRTGDHLLPWHIGPRGRRSEHPRRAVPRRLSWSCATMRAGRPWPTTPEHGRDDGFHPDAGWAVLAGRQHPVHRRLRARRLQRRGGRSGRRGPPRPRLPGRGRLAHRRRPGAPVGRRHGRCRGRRRRRPGRGPRPGHPHPLPRRRRERLPAGRRARPGGGPAAAALPGSAAGHLLVALRGAGLDGRKVEWLRGVAEAALDGRLDAARLRAMPRERALTELRTLPGIGPCAAELTLLRGAGDPDHFPGNEPRMQRAMVRAYGLEAQPTPERLRAIAERWQPYRTWVSLLLRTALEDATHEISGQRR